MVKLVIDGKPLEVEDGTTILSAARHLGVRIPTLCQVDGFKPSTSCFICAVRIEGRAGLWPSCAMPVSDGMVVWASSDDVRDARKTALELLLSDHTGDCIAPCRTGCPARLDIPGFTSKIAGGDLRGAAEVVQDYLTLPASLGRICPHLCEQRCRRGELEESISIRHLHRFCADRDLGGPDPFVPGKDQTSGKSVAIVGAGPAGLSAAYHLLRRGHGVVLVDAHRHPGGMLRYGIPEFRLPRNILDGEIDVIRKLGGEFRLQTKLGVDVKLEQLRREFQAVFLAIGAQGSRGLGCPGEELARPAVDFLAQVSEGLRPEIGESVIVVGGGNTAMDAARTAVRLGATSVKILYRRSRTEMPCLMEEVEAAEAEGVQVDLLVAPVRLERADNGLRLTCQRMALGPPDESGRRRPVAVSGSDFTVAASSVISAIGQTVEMNSGDVPGLQLSQWGIAVNPQTLATNLDGVFAGGDGVTGPDVAIRAVAAGKLAAVSIDQYLSGRPILGAPEPVNVMMGRLDEAELAILFRQIEMKPRARMPERPAAERRLNFEEVDLGLPDETAARESGRCLGCGCWKATACQLREYASEYHADPRRFAGPKRRFNRDVSHAEIVYEAGKCIVCGVCVQVAAAAGEELGLTIVDRGFETVVAVPFGRTIAEGLKQSARRAAEACPTGALALRGQGCGGCGGLAGLAGPGAVSGSACAASG